MQSYFKALFSYFKFNTLFVLVFTSILFVFTQTHEQSCVLCRFTLLVAFIVMSLIACFCETPKIIFHALRLACSDSAFFSKLKHDLVGNSLNAHSGTLRHSHF